jgi:phosphatidylserine/phosphatidylglycerophosphate/cardiolipin synthase-like enzyme
VIEVRTLTQGAQTAEEIAGGVIAFVDGAQHSLDVALYDVRLPGPVGDRVRASLEGAAGRGVAVRLIYNRDDARAGRPLPPPTRTEPGLLESLAFPTKAIPGDPDLMHHKYLVRDSTEVWTGSTNWTLDSWEREENVIATVASPPLAALYAANFAELWRDPVVERSGEQDTRAIEVGEVSLRAWFCPGRGRALSLRIAEAIGRARERVRIASPVITAGPILGTLAEEIADGRLDVAGIVDGPQVEQVFHQWKLNGNAAWKTPLLQRVMSGRFATKASTPWRPGSVHDFMHAKILVADDTVFLGSFNLSHSGEMNAENVLEIPDPALADRLAGQIDEWRERYAGRP